MSGLRPHGPPIVIDARADSDANARAERLGTPAFKAIVIPRTDTPAMIRIASRKEMAAARAGARGALQQAGYALDGGGIASLGAAEEWNYQLGMRILAAAVCDPKNTDRALAPLEEWEEHCDEDQIAALMKEYDDHRAQIDPLADGSLSEAEFAALVDAAKKKDFDSLMAFGSRKLSSFVTTLVDLPATSPTQRS